MTSLSRSSKIRGTAILVSLVSAGLTFACGSDDEDSDGGVGGDGDIGVGLGDGDLGTGLGDGDNGALNSNANGGEIELTAAQVRDLQNASCTGWATEGENLPATLQLVVDASSSMNNTAPGSRQSKWVVTRDALASAIDSLPASVAVGMLHYPNLEVADGEECVNSDARTPIAPLGTDGSNQRETLDDALNTAIPNTGTPTYEAYDIALNSGLLPYQAANRFMLLITDGAPTIDEGCVYGVGDGEIEDSPTQPIVDLIAGAYDDHGIRTFIIGSPGSEQSSADGGDMRPWLSRAAMEGGTDSNGCSENGPEFCHMDMTQDADFAASLRTGLAAVASQIIDACTFAVPDAPDGEVLDPNETNLVITWGSGESSLILPDAKGDCDQGWRFNDAGEIALCPSSCGAVKLDNQARVQLTFGCAQEEIDSIIK
jgi:hypothetical protein